MQAPPVIRVQGIAPGSLEARVLEQQFAPAISHFIRSQRQNQEIGGLQVVRNTARGRYLDVTYTRMHGIETVTIAPKPEFFSLVPKVEPLPEQFLGGVISIRAGAWLDYRATVGVHFNGVKLGSLDTYNSSWFNFSGGDIPDTGRDSAMLIVFGEATKLDTDYPRAPFLPDPVYTTSPRFLPPEPFIGSFAEATIGIGPREDLYTKYNYPDDFYLDQNTETGRAGVMLGYDYVTTGNNGVLAYTYINPTIVELPDADLREQDYNDLKFTLDASAVDGPLGSGDAFGNGLPRVFIDVFSQFYSRNAEEAVATMSTWRRGAQPEPVLVRRNAVSQSPTVYPDLQHYSIQYPNGTPDGPEYDIFTSETHINLLTDVTKGTGYIDGPVTIYYGDGTIYRSWG